MQFIWPFIYNSAGHSSPGKQVILLQVIQTGQQVINLQFSGSFISSYAGHSPTGQQVVSL
jgi:hypothetical protein